MSLRLEVAVGSTLARSSQHLSWEYAGSGRTSIEGCKLRTKRHGARARRGHGERGHGERRSCAEGPVLREQQRVDERRVPAGTGPQWVCGLRGVAPQFTRRRLHRESFHASGELVERLSARAPCMALSHSLQASSCEAPLAGAVTCCASMGRDMGLRAARSWRGALSSPTPRLDRSGCVSRAAGSNTTQARHLLWSREGRGGGGARARRCSASAEWIGALMVGLGWWGSAACRAGYFHRSRCGDRLWSVFVEATGASRWFVGRGWRSSRGTRGVPSSGAFSERGGAVHIRSAGSSS